MAKHSTVWDGYLDIKLRAINKQFVESFQSRNELYDYLCDHRILIDDARKLTNFILPHEQSFSLDRATGKKCFMLSARELIIAHGDNPEYWAWESNTTSRFPEVAELLAVCWLDVKGSIDLNMLSPSTTYAAYLVFSLTQHATGLDIHTIKGQVNINNELNPIEGEPAKYLEDPMLRDDGWMEVKLGQGFVEGGETGVFEARFFEIELLNWKSGIIIEGIEMRPTSIGITPI